MVGGWRFGHSGASRRSRCGSGLHRGDRRVRAHPMPVPRRCGWSAPATGHPLQRQSRSAATRTSAGHPRSAAHRSGDHPEMGLAGRARAGRGAWCVVRILQSQLRCLPAHRRALDGLRHRQHRRRCLRRAPEGVGRLSVCGVGIGRQAAAASARGHRCGWRRNAGCGAGDRSAAGHAGDRGHRRHLPHDCRMRGRDAGRCHDLVRHHRPAHPHDATAGDSGGRATLRGGR